MRLIELLRLAVEVGGIGIYETDFESGRTRFSPELCHILGLAQGTEMSYGDAFQLFDERDRGAVIAKVEAAARSPNKGKWSGVHRLLRVDGAVRWVFIHGRRFYRDTASGPQPVRSIGTVLDITHLKETDAALRDSEHRLRLALEAAQMGTFEADITGSQALIDAQEARLLGLPEDTRVVSADALRARIPLEDLHASDAKKERLTQHREAYNHEFRLRTRDGSERWLCAHAAVLANRIFGVTFDVTQRKLTEASLRDSEARLRIAASGAALGIFEWIPETDTAIWENDRMYEIFARSRADGPLTKRQFVDSCLDPKEVDGFEAALQEATWPGGNFHKICLIRRKDGASRWLQFDGKFETIAPDSPLRLVGVVADITARKKLECRAKELSERIETVQDEERKNIARELHNSTAQHLVAASLTLMSLRPKASLSQEQERLWNEAEACIAEAAKELRTFSYLMHPPALRAHGLCPTMRQYIDGFASRSGISVKFRSNRKVDRLPFRTQRALFRVVQAALANVFHHASASLVSVDLRWIAKRVHLIITDNGRGQGRVRRHGACPTLRHGVGIRGIRARLDEIGGRLEITRVRPQGIRIHAAVPARHARRKTGSGGADADWPHDINEPAHA